MQKVKGTIFAPWVKGIKADKSGVYDTLLTEEDKAVLSKLILSSSWYSFETYRNCVNAVAKIVAKDDGETIRQWGRAYSDEIMTSVYKHAIKKGDPKAAMDQFLYVFKSMFDFGKVNNELLAGGEMLVSIEAFEPDFEMFYHITRGWLERFIELCLDKSVQSEFVKKSWASDPVTQIKVSW